MNRLTSGEADNAKSILSLAPARRPHDSGIAEVEASPDASPRLRSIDAVFEAYLARSPLAHALFRAAELKPIAGCVLRRPVLDVGCGGAEFACTSMDAPLDVGVDLSRRQLELARVTDRYEQLVEANATALPLDHETFSTVMSISVLEHIHDYKSVIREMHRVLKPGGVLLVTVVLRDLHANLLGARVLQRLGLARLRRRYLAFNDWLFRHVTMLSRPEWEQEVARAGFDSIETQAMVGTSATIWWECLMWVALPYKMTQLAGRPFMWRPRWMCRMLRRAFSSCVDASANEGSCLLIVARKPSDEQEDTDHDQGSLMRRDS